MGEDKKKKELEELYRQYLQDVGPTAKEKLGGAWLDVKTAGKGRLKEFAKEPKINWFVRFILPLFVVYQAFFPGLILGTGVGFVIALIAIIIVIALVVAYTSGGIVKLGGSIILDIVVPVAIVVAVFILTRIIGTPDYFSKVAPKLPNGSLTVNVLFLISAGLAGLVGLVGKKPLSLGAGVGGLYGLLFIAIPLFISYNKPYSICMQLPFISQYCNPREVRVQGPEIVTIPVSGGVGLTYGAPQIGRPSATLYAGEPYEYTFTFTNHYSVPITFKLNMSIVSRYATGVKFNFPFTQRISELKPNQFYQDGVFIDPAQLTAEEVYGCPYYVWQINATQKIPAEKVECAKDKPCNITGKSCVKTDYMECKCVGWNETTCSGAALYLHTDVEHTGYFVGLANLYYSSINEPPKPAYRLTQGPLSVTVEFQPNPYIGPVHYYRNDTSLYVTFKNMGGDITITSLNVTPLVTNITTIDKEKGMMLEEIVGVEKKWCREEEIVGRFIPSGREFSLMLCKLTPPYVNTTLKNLTDNRTIEINNVTFDRILYYCNKIKVPQNYWNVIDWYKEGDIIEVPGNFTIIVGPISEDSVEINVTLPSGTSKNKSYGVNEQLKEEGLEFTVLNISEGGVQLNISSNVSIGTAGYTFWSSYWENIYKGIDESGLCELLKKGNESESKIVSNALKYTQVKIEFTYVRKTTFESGKIVPYTRTEECMALANETSA